MKIERLNIKFCKFCRRCNIVNLSECASNFESAIFQSIHTKYRQILVSRVFNFSKMKETYVKNKDVDYAEWKILVLTSWEWNLWSVFLISKKSKQVSFFLEHLLYIERMLVFLAYNLPFLNCISIILKLCMFNCGSCAYIFSMLGFE